MLRNTRVRESNNQVKMNRDSFELSPRRTKVGLVNDCDRLRKRLENLAKGEQKRQKHRKRPREINSDRKEGESWLEGRSESRERTEGNKPRERDRRFRTGRLGQTAVSSLYWWPRCCLIHCYSICSDHDRIAIGFTEGRCFGIKGLERRCQELSGAVNGCIVLERDTGAEYVLTDPGVIRDWFWGAKHGYCTVRSGWLMGSRKTARKECMDGLSDNKAPRQASIEELTRDFILGVIKADLPFVWENRGLLKSTDPDSEVNKQEGLTKSLPRLKEGKPAGVRIESSGSRKPRMLRKSLSKTRNCQGQ
ncbi:hypothetical protein F2Q69_00053314 [Brassica cretica]|uniref:Uncharacterized protein n=2 Tax=Brassica cretica TaxID=69181 RepID=A0A8S9N616_BRACR|nr:hypothetical protein F2Q69_00053314 [Brassica cretica]